MSNTRPGTIDYSGYGYRCSAGETFDSVALKIYNNERFAAELLCANPHLSAKMRFDGTETLLLPIIPDAAETATTTASTTAPWKE